MHRKNNESHDVMHCELAHLVGSAYIQDSFILRDGSCFQNSQIFQAGAEIQENLKDPNGGTLLCNRS